MTRRQQPVAKQGRVGCYFQIPGTSGTALEPWAQLVEDCADMQYQMQLHSLHARDGSEGLYPAYSLLLNSIENGENGQGCSDSYWGLFNFTFLHIYHHGLNVDGLWFVLC